MRNLRKLLRCIEIGICTWALLWVAPTAYGLDPDTDLSNVSASFIGEDEQDRAGWSVSRAGDVNGDGYDDILIGAPENDGNGTNAGQAYLILGKAPGWSMDIDLSAADASFIGEDEFDNAGRSVSGAGDVNGDGYDDILIGASGDEEGGYTAGQAYLILGKASGWSMGTNLSAADASFIGEDEYDDAGSKVSGAGDVNGDGYDDFLIASVDDEEGGGEGAGQVYLILGKASGWSMDTDLSAADASFWGESAGDQAGSAVSGAGDVNGDGYDDLLIGAFFNDDGGSDAGQAYLILGKAYGWSMDTDLSAADASFIGEDAGDRAGWSVSGAGDVNGDGYDDLLIGASDDSDSDSKAGQAYLILGKASGWSMDTNLSTADASFWGENAGDYAGSTVSDAGDVNGDGYDDLLVGAPYNGDSAAGAGQVYLILGKASGWSMDTNLSAADASFWGEDAGDYAGYSISGAGDANGDGYDDLLIGAIFDDDGGVSAGQAYLVLSDYAAPSEVEVTLPARSVCPGRTVFIPVTVSDATGLSIHSAQMTITYDSNVVRMLAAANEGTLTEDWALDYAIVRNLEGTTDTVRVALATPFTNVLSGSGVLVLLRAIVPSAASIGDATSLTFERFMFNEGIPSAGTHNGSVTVVSLLGDVTGNEEVSAYDAAVILTEVVGLIVLPSPSWPSFTLRVADVSGNGEISAYDAALIMRYVVGLLYRFPAEGGEALSAKEGEMSRPAYTERTIAMGEVERRGDGSAMVPLLIDEMEAVISGELELSWEGAGEPEVRVAELTSDYLSASNAHEGRIRFSFASAESPIGGGTIAEIVFSSAPEALFIDRVRLNEGRIPVRVANSEAPTLHRLHPNHPNPFNPETTLRYDVAKAGTVRLSIYTLTGQLVRVLVDGDRPAGAHAVIWDGTDEAGKAVASSVYLCRMEVDAYRAVRKLVLAR